MSETLIVLGATSLIGRRLPGAAGGLRLAGVSRRSEPRPDYADWITADLTEGGFGRGLPEAERALILSPVWTAAAAVPSLAEKGVRRIVAISSTSRFTKAHSPDPAERAVAQALATGEARLREVCAERGVVWTILRPTLIYDEGLDGNVTRLARLIRKARFLPLAGGGRGLRQPVHAADLARGCLDALERSAARSKAYDLAGGETLTYREMAGRIFDALGLRRRIVPLPAWAWRAAFTLARPLLPGAGAQMGARMQDDLVFDDAEARRDLGWSPRPFRPDFRDF